MFEPGNRKSTSGTPPGFTSHDRFVIVSDDQEWVEEAFAVGIRVGTHPEVVTWRRASELRLPLAFILADVDHGVENQEPVLWRWARLGLQPITILSLSPRIQVSETAHRFRQLGYDRFVFPSPSLRPTSEYWDLVVAEIERTQSVLTFIPLAMQVLDRHDPLLVRGLQILCCDFSIRTVHEWSRQLNLPLAKHTRRVAAKRIAASEANPGSFPYFARDLLCCSGRIDSS